MSDIVRDELGRFVAGAPSPNPFGSPRAPKKHTYLRNYSLDNFDKYIRVLEDIVFDPTQKGDVRVRAATWVLEHGFGKAPVNISFEDITDGRAVDPANMTGKELLMCVMPYMRQRIEEFDKNKEDEEEVKEPANHVDKKEKL